MRIFNLLKEICLKLGLIADYVIERGTSGIWTYRKWASGDAECWGTGIATGVATQSLLGGFYTYVDFSLPTNLFNELPICIANASTGTGVSGGTYASATSKNVMRIYVVGNQNDKSVRSRMRVFGTWK